MLLLEFLPYLLLTLVLCLAAWALLSYYEDRT